MVRPGPLRWLLYCCGVGLPPVHRGWVLRDVTVRTWRLRHFLRATVQLLPIAVLLYVFVPGEAWVRAMAVVGGLLIGYFYALAYMHESAEHRAVKAGYPVGYAASVRAEAQGAKLRAQADRYAQQWRRGAGT